MNGTEAGTNAELADAIRTQLCPVGLPVISAQMLVDDNALQLLRASADLHQVNMGGREIGWIVTSYNIAEQVLADPQAMGDVPANNWLIRPDTPGEDNDSLPDEEDLFFLPSDEHSRIRRMITRQLSNRRVANLNGRIQLEIDRLLDALPLGEPVDFIAAFGRPLPVTVLCELLEIPEGEREYIRSYAFGWIAGYATPPPVTKRAGVPVADYFSSLIAERRVKGGDDLISSMIRTDPAATDQDVLTAIRLLLVAGHRPVTSILTRGVRTLLAERQHWEQLVRDPTCVDDTVEELLRYVTPTALSSRYLRKATQLGGVALPPGSGVHCALYAVNRDPARFDDPDKFDPHRQANPHLSFGLGRKHCLGAALARAEARLAIGTLAKRFPRIALATGSPRSTTAGPTMQVVLDPHCQQERQQNPPPVSDLQVSQSGGGRRES